MTTTDKTLAGLKAWITYRAPAELAEVPIYLRDDATERDFPCIVLSDTGAEEHPVLRGVLSIGIEAKLLSVAVDEPESDDTYATSTDDHRTIAGQLADILGETAAAVDFLTARDGLKCFDLRGAAPTTEPDDEGHRATTIQLGAVACPR